MFKKILIILFVVVGGFVFFVAVQPSDYTIGREIVVLASPEKLFPYINNIKLTDSWMPWSEQDPHLKMVYGTIEEGVGAYAAWDSPGKMGTGKAEVVESVPNQLVKTQLTYTKPMEMSQVAEISLEPTETGTTVKWAVTGNNTFVGRIFCLFMDMDKTVGKEFEKGLNNLKNIVESLPQ